MPEELSGIYFGETVSTITSSTTEDEDLCFLVQTSTAIETLDNQLKYYTNIEDFKTDVQDKGLTKTTEFIEAVLALAGRNRFYVYSIKTDTAAGFKEAVTCSTDIKEIRKVIYFEETASTQQNSLSTKMNALASACHDVYKYGAFRIAYVIPKATIEAAVAAAENVLPATTVVNTFQTLLTGDGDGRLAIMVPDQEANVMATIEASPFYQDAGKNNLLGTVGELKYKFTREQMKTLLNLGVMFIRSRRISGTIQYRLEGGISTSFKNGKADGTLSARQTADELLHQCDIALDVLINDEDQLNNVAFAQTAVDDVVGNFIAGQYVTESGTNLTVNDAGNMKFTITGEIETVKPLRTIEVNTIIK